MCLVRLAIFVSHAVGIYPKLVVGADVRIPFHQFLVAMAGIGALVDGVEWPEDAESQSGSSWLPVAPGEPLNKLRIGKSTYGYNYDKLGDGLWQCERCSDQAPREDGQRWRVFVRIEPSQIVAFGDVALEGGGHNVDTEHVRF